MPEYDAAKWSEFALGQLGASAALLGLVFVALSINLRDVVGSTVLVNRASETVIVLANVLVSATIVLIPGQDRAAVSAELLVIAIATFSITWRLQQSALAHTREAGERGPSAAQTVVRRALSLGSQVLLVVVAVTLAVKAGGGFYWWPAAVIGAYVSGLTNAWVLLIEILR